MKERREKKRRQGKEKSWRAVDGNRYYHPYRGEVFSTTGDCRTWTDRRKTKTEEPKLS